MSDYLNSDQHKVNLGNAQKKAQEKVPCQYCDNGYNKLNIGKHERACKKNPANMKECPVCSKLFSSVSKTCSYSCSNTYFRKGPDHGNWSETAYRSTCFHYHKKECVVCKENLIVEVHHLDEDHTNNSPENLIPLCPTHHQYWHSRHKRVIEPLILDYVKNWSG